MKTLFACGLLFALISVSAQADQALLKTHCGQCHGGSSPEGDFRVKQLAGRPAVDSVGLWKTSLDYVRAGEMPPAEHDQPDPVDRRKIIAFLRDGLQQFDRNRDRLQVSPRRMNNREFANSIRDVLMIEDVGTHLPTDNLIGDSLHDGFDTHGDTLGFSRFHLEQYIDAVRRIVDATVLVGERPPSRTYRIRSDQIIEAHTSQNTSRRERRGLPDGYDFLDPLKAAYLQTFDEVPETGWYRLKIRCTGKDRGRYPSEETGVYDDDPIRLAVQMGGREKIFELPDEDVFEIELEEWMAEGTRLRFSHPTDGLRMKGNGNFKFQNAITGRYLEQHDRATFDRVVASAKTNRNRRQRSPYDWHNWVDHWMGPRPRIFDVQVEGPFYRSWPPERQTALLGDNPRVEDSLAILRPIAERAWRRSVPDGHLRDIVKLVEDKASDLGDVEALKEGIVAILVSPPFLLLDQEQLSSDEKFASRLSLFLYSTVPDDGFRARAAELNSFEQVRTELQSRFAAELPRPFLKSFPEAWLKLNDINFMAPDPDYFRHYHRKRVSEDMVDEVLAFFENAVRENVPIPELINADYSFVNADLAEVYGLDDVPQDSRLRKYQFQDGRRGGVLGTGAFLTITADSLGTSPIHRAVYVMENILGMHPDPPPAGVDIQEPDVRSAKTIREVLDAHRSDRSCAACHQSIDPWGYAFENFGPMGSWRDVYEVPGETVRSDSRNRKDRIAIDASARFRNGSAYRDIREFRQLMTRPSNRDRFVRCFVMKLLKYATGEEPDNFTEVERIVAISAAHEYRIVDTMAAVISSPLFRD